MKALTLTIVILALVVYVVIGGCIFHAIESGKEENASIEVTGARAAFLSKYSGCVSEEDLKNLIQSITSAYDQGISLKDNGTSPTNWGIASSVFFATTVVTTIGYGNISPSTSGGRVFCIFFALIGIPLFAVAAGGLGVKLKNLTDLLSQKMASSCCGKHPKFWQNFRTVSILLGAICVFLFIPAAVFYAIEDEWTYGEAVYYAFVTLTTIGFGDYVAGADMESGPGRIMYRLTLAVWILFGLAWMASFISQVQSLYDEWVDKTEQKVDALDKKREADKHGDTKEEKVREEEKEKDKDSTSKTEVGKI